MRKRKILMTSALPYANGPIHLGHVVENLMVDFWVRFQRMQGHECLFFSADDTHGTPIMIQAKKLKKKPEDLIAEVNRDHQNDFADFGIEFNHYGSTNSAANKRISEETYNDLLKADCLEKQMLSQLFCNTDQMFLPDRFVKGTCPKCKTPEQYGDQCESCNASYNPSELLKPHCSVCGTTPVLKETEHVFFKLGKFEAFLKDWIPKGTTPTIANKLREWIDQGLKGWCISRDAPYFGFAIPGFKDKYFYVWVDAPLGYISTTLEWCEKHGKNFDEIWGKKSSFEVYHTIGKDIINFHALFWPAMLQNTPYRLPNKIFVHGFLTFNGEKMSKSKGTFLPARVYLNHMDPLYLRYYLACKMNSGVDDFDFSATDFVGRVNSDLVGKITNVASRGAQMLQKSIDGKMGTVPAEFMPLIDLSRAKASLIAEHYENRDFSKAMVEIRAIADAANHFFDQHEPWKLIKTDVEKTRAVLTTILNSFRIMAIYMAPIVPKFSENVALLFGDKPYTWDDAQSLVEDRTLKPFVYLAQRIEASSIEAMIEETRRLYATTKPGGDAQVTETSTNEISIDDFNKVDLRVGLITAAVEIPEAEKLLKLTIDIGNETRTVFSGIKSAYSASELVGKHVVLVANLKPRKMKFGVSEGMVLACGPGGKDIFLVEPDLKAKPGEKIS